MEDEQKVEKLVPELYYDLLGKYSTLKYKNSELRQENVSLRAELSGYKTEGSLYSPMRPNLYKKGVKACEGWVRRMIVEGKNKTHLPLLHELVRKFESFYKQSEYEPKNN